MRVVIVLPTYNERENILTLLKNLEAIAPSIENHVLWYLVVDDNSPDGTQEEVRLYQKKHTNVSLVTGTKEGLGKALLRGLGYAQVALKADILVQMDADLSHDPNALPKFLTAIDRGADIAIGSRYISGGSIPENWGIHRKIFSIVGNSIVRFGLGFTQVHDWTGGYRVFRSKLFDAVKNEMSLYRGYVFQIAFLHKLLIRKIKIVEIPIRFTDRLYGKSKIAPSEYIHDVLEYVVSERIKQMTESPFRKFLVVGTLGFTINTVVLEVMVHLGFQPTIGSIVGAELAIVSNFLLNNVWTFRNRKIEGVAQVGKFLQFNGTSLGALIIQAAAIFLGTNTLGVSSYRVFYVIGVGFALIWNYVMYSRVIWK